MPVQPYDALHLKYVWDPTFGLTASRKAALLGMKERAYWEAVGRAEFWVFARLESAQAQTTAVVEKIIKEALRERVVSATNLTHRDKAPKLSFTALNRPKLTLKSV